MTEEGAFSFAGWNFGEWIKGNAELIKLVVSGLTALSLIKSPVLAISSGVLLKLVLDVFHYYVKE